MHGLTIAWNSTLDEHLVSQAATSTHSPGRDCSSEKRERADWPRLSVYWLTLLELLRQGHSPLVSRLPLSGTYDDLSCHNMHAAPCVASLTLTSTNGYQHDEWFHTFKFERRHGSRRREREREPILISAESRWCERIRASDNEIENCSVFLSKVVLSYNFRLSDPTIVAADSIIKLFSRIQHD